MRALPSNIRKILIMQRAHRRPAEKKPLHQTINSDAAVPFKIQILFCPSPFAGIAASHGSVLL